MTVVINRLQAAGSNQALKIGAVPKSFFPNISHNDNSAAPASPLVAAYDALSQDTSFLAVTDDKNNWSLDWY